MRGNEVAAVGSGANIDQPAEGNGHLCLIIDAAASMQQQTYYGVYYGVFPTSKHSKLIPENMFLKPFAGNSF